MKVSSSAMAFDFVQNISCHSSDSLNTEAFQNLPNACPNDYDIKIYPKKCFLLTAHYAVFVLMNMLL